MTTLFSYCIRYDLGSAPNPFWGMCTLVICKLAIRRAVQVGDWIMGTGSTNSPIGDIRGQVVYVMQVTDKMSMRAYESYVREHLPEKVPRWVSSDPRRMVGDAIYDFSVEPPKVRQSVHCEGDRARDLRGEWALLSERFYYFGDRPRALPEHLLGLVKKGPSHRSRANDGYIEAFLVWLDGLGLEPNGLYGKPQGSLFREQSLNLDSRSECRSRRTGQRVEVGSQACARPDRPARKADDGRGGCSQVDPR